jgi:hypothetical protein
LVIMTKVLVTFDLEGAEPDDYEALLEVGLSRVSAQKKLRLPFSSVLGDTGVGRTAREICDALVKLLQEATGKRAERVLVGVASDWACNGPVDDDLWLQEIVQRFEAATIRLSR